jgi:hypothetical protein
MAIIELRFEALKRYRQAAAAVDPAERRRLRDEGDALTNQAELLVLALQDQFS